MRRFLPALIALVLFPVASPAQEAPPVPDRHIAISRDTDFPGGDIRSIFDTSFEACERACLTDPACRAFTFNTRSNSCFPKTGVGDRAPYEGALSAIVVSTDARVLDQAPARRADLTFLGQGDIEAARSFAAGIGKRHYVNDWSLQALLDGAAGARARGDQLNALRFTGSALALADEASLWIDYAEAALAIESDDWNTKRDYQNRAVWAATNAYLRAGNRQVQVNALLPLARALERQGRGRDMIPALRLAQALAPRDDTATLLDSAIGKYGFRITEDRVESDAAAPRLCATFSEDLARAGVDYTPFVQLPEAGLSVSASGRDLCVEGLSHGSRYRVTFREGLPAQSGERLTKDVTLTAYVRDRAPSLRFPGRAYVLPKAGEAALPLVTVNLSEVQLTLSRVADRNLVRVMQEGYLGRPLSYWEEAEFNSTIAEEVWTGTAQVAQELNRDVTTRLPLADVLGGMPAGIYTLRASIDGADPYDSPTATQWFVLSDLGLTAYSGADGVHVIARSLATAEAVAGAEVTLVSRGNRVLGETLTDDQGVAHFAPGLALGRDAAAPALVTVRKGDEDLAFLSLSDPGFDLSDRGVEGRPPAGPIDLFLSTDRGAYRPGEVIHATALARDGTAKAIPGLPLTAVLTRPDGVEYSRETSARDVAGGHVFGFGLSGSVPRGTWLLAVHADPKAPPLATQRLLVEDFLPERIDFTLDLPEGPIRPDAPPRLSLEARYLFGAPAGDLPVEGDLRISAAASVPGFPGYRFGRHDSRFSPRYGALPKGLRTDAAGRLDVPLTLPDAGATDKPLEARVTLRVSEGSGRPVERSVTRPLAPAGTMIGIRPQFDGAVPENSEAGFDVVALGPDMAPRETRVRWTLNRVQTRYQWYQMYGNWDWEPVTTRTRITAGEAVMEGGRLTVTAPVEWGRYELVVDQIGGAAGASSEFYAGWYAPADASATPDMLELSLDKPAYAPGDTATLRMVPRHAGKALVSVLSNRLIAMQVVDLRAGENAVEIPVTDDWGAGAYVTATLIRPMDVPAGRNPARSLGLAYAPVDPGARQLQAAFDMAPEATPRAPLDVALRVEGAEAGQQVYATIAAVDLGILNLTGFQSPDPSSHYFGQRKLGVEMRDVYGRLIDGMNGAMGQVRSGGDGAAQMRRQAPPPTEELAAFFSGPLTVGPDGLARASFDLPAFNGTLRLMAVAWTDSAVGQAQTDILVRDPVVVTASLPRFLAPGDRSRLLLEITHATGPAGRMGLDVSADGVTLEAAAIPSGLTLGAQEKVTLSIPVTAMAPGQHSLRVALTTPEGRQLVKTLALPVQLNDPEVTRTDRFTLAAGDSFTFDDNAFAGLMPGSGHAVLQIGPVAQFDAGGLLQALDRYPYGCTEQITSKAMPLLYLSDLAETMGLATAGQLGTRIDQSVTEVLNNQSSNGAFGLWYPDNGDLWLDAFVTDFLSRARARGHDVPATAFRAALDNLRNQVNYAADFDQGGEALAYALMVLAREGAAAVGDLRYYADVKGGDFATPLAMAQLGAALASYGDQPRADAMFARAAGLVMRQSAGDEAPLWRADYGTHLRDAAGVLALAVAAGSEAVDTATLTALVTRPGGERSTQEALWTLLAANALIDRQGGQGFALNGVPVDGPLLRLLAQGSGETVLSNLSGDPATLTLTTYGVPSEPVPAGGNGYAISRSYFTLEGQPVTPAEVITGTRLVAVVEVTPFARSEARLMVDDPLPAGFEIDNPSLLRSGDIRALDWLEVLNSPAFAQFRQDRFLAAVDWTSGEPFRPAYILRATTPGSYRHPAASVSDMYRPDRRAWTDAGQVTIRE